MMRFIPFHTAHVHTPALPPTTHPAASTFRTTHIHMRAHAQGPSIPHNTRAPPQAICSQVVAEACYARHRMSDVGAWVCTNQEKQRGNRNPHPRPPGFKRSLRAFVLPFLMRSHRDDDLQRRREHARVATISAVPRGSLPLQVHTRWRVRLLHTQPSMTQ